MERNKMEWGVKAVAGRAWLEEEVWRTCLASTVALHQEKRVELRRERAKGDVAADDRGLIGGEGGGVLERFSRFRERATTQSLSAGLGK